MTNFCSTYRSSSSNPELSKVLGEGNNDSQLVPRPPSANMPSKRRPEQKALRLTRVTDLISLWESKQDEQMQSKSKRQDFIDIRQGSSNSMDTLLVKSNSHQSVDSSHSIPALESSGSASTFDTVVEQDNIVQEAIDNNVEDEFISHYSDGQIAENEEVINVAPEVTVSDITLAPPAPVILTTPTVNTKISRPPTPTMSKTERGKLALLPYCKHISTLPKIEECPSEYEYHCDADPVEFTNQDNDMLYSLPIPKYVVRRRMSREFRDALQQAHAEALSNHERSRSECDDVQHCQTYAKRDMKPHIETLLDAHLLEAQPVLVYKKSPGSRKRFTSIFTGIFQKNQ